MKNKNNQSPHSFTFTSWSMNEKEQGKAIISSWFTKKDDPSSIDFTLINDEQSDTSYFELLSNNQRIEIRASSMEGLFYGFEEYKRNKESSFQQSTCTALVDERSLLLDIGRKYYSKEWIFSLIDLMSELKLNTLQLHFSDNEGFRIESTSYPSIVSKEHLKKSEVKEIISYAKKHYIQVIPELDTPGHLKKFLKKYPQWRLNRVGKANEFIDYRALDITNSEAVSAIHTLLFEYFDLFRESTYFHLGADEFIDFDSFHEYPILQETAKKRYGRLATGIELYIDYTNQLIEEAKKAGFIPRVWSDGFYRKNQSSIVALSKDVQITYWTRWNEHMSSIDDYLEQGYEVINFNDNYFYFVLGEAAGYRYPNAEKIRKEWSINLFAGDQKITQAQLSNVIGTSFAIWSDQPEALTEEQVMEKLVDPLKAYAEKLWESERRTC